MRGLFGKFGDGVPYMVIATGSIVIGQTHGEYDVSEGTSYLSEHKFGEIRKIIEVFRVLALHVLSFRDFVKGENECICYMRAGNII